jgi:hypothetical protein
VSRGASHVGMVIGGGRFVHAPSSRGVVRVEPYTAGYWMRRFVGARRIDEPSNRSDRSEGSDRRNRTERSSARVPAGA